MNGLLLLDKPQNITSFSAVSAVKRAAHEKRVGHTGTLDPMATGVLPVLLGRATALSSLLLDGNKKYVAEIKLGTVTDTDDITGEVLSEKGVNVTPDQLENALKGFVGKISQYPPIYSAIKKDGVRLYKLAREGKEVKTEARNVEIFHMNLISPLNDQNIFKIETFVSKGTYIRSLARDIGEVLGCGATLFSLRRTFAGGFDISECTPLEEITENSVEGFILNEEKAVAHLKEIGVTQNQATRFCNGGQLAFDRLNLNTEEVTSGEFFRIKYKDLFLGVGFADLEKQQIGIKCIINYPKGQEG